MFDIGRICVKIAGRDAGKSCVVIGKEGEFVLIDGETRRRKCNPLHLEPTDQVIEIKDGASHNDVITAFSKLGLVARQTKPKKAVSRPKKVKEQPEKATSLKVEAKPKKTAEKKPKSKPAKAEE
jgi:large subunit ribosomal protein L14e